MVACGSILGNIAGALLARNLADEAVMTMIQEDIECTIGRTTKRRSDEVAWLWVTTRAANNKGDNVWLGSLVVKKCSIM